MKTARAPRQRAFTTSLPLRTPPSKYTSACPFTAAITSGSTRKVGAEPFVFLKFCFTNLRVTSVNLAGPGDEGVEETVSFSFGSIVEKYTQQAADGSAGPSFTFGWDLVKYVQLGNATQDAC